MKFNSLVESKFGESLGGLKAIEQKLHTKDELEPHLSSVTV